MKFIILACFIAVASAGVINHQAPQLAYSAIASPVSYSNGISAIPSPVSYSNVYNSPVLRSAPYYPSVSPLAYNAYNPIPAYNSYAAQPLAYNGYGISPLAYNAQAIQPYGQQILRNPYIRSYPYSLY